MIAVLLLVIVSAPADQVTAEINAQFVNDSEARALALELYRAHGDVATVGADETMDGGFRGTIHLVPQLPTGAYRQHLVWVSAIATDLDSFFTTLFADAAPTFHWKPLMFRFMRSVGRSTPSAYALIDADGYWTIYYNVSGSLMTSRDRVREVVTHELFHINDAAHNDWAVRTLAHDVDAIVKKCGARTSCLAPYAPTTVKVRGGTYYAFQPNNGAIVREYAAELAVRYFNEQAAVLASRHVDAFKCGAPENARAWQALVDEFFAGVDRVPACASRGPGQTIRTTPATPNR